MKKFMILSAAVLVLTIGVVAFVKPGQTRLVTIGAMTTEAAPNETATAETEIRLILEKYYEIVQTGDREALKKFSREISAPEYLYSSELGLKDKSATIRLFDAVRTEISAAGFDDLKVQIHGETAVAKYRDVSKISVNGAPVKNPVRFTNVWVKRGGNWLIVAEHSSVITALPELLPRHPNSDNLAQK